MAEFNLLVSPDKLSAVAIAIRDASASINKAFSLIENQMSESETYWSGEAATLNRSLFREQVPLMEDMILRFSNAADKLETVAGALTQTQANIINDFETLPSEGYF